MVSPAQTNAANSRESFRPQSIDRLGIVFPEKADGLIEVRRSDAPGVWIKERLVKASNHSSAQLAEGRLFYPAAQTGVDRIYEIGSQRVEEYLHLRDTSALSNVVYEVQTGEQIAELRVDRSGYGLEAVDANGVTVLKAPQPRGLDSKGNSVSGKLVIHRDDDSHYTVSIELLPIDSEPQFPLLLDPSWVTASALSFARSYGKCTKGCAAGDGGGVEWALTERITMANESETGVSKNGAKGAKRADPVGFLNPLQRNHRQPPRRKSHLPPRIFALPVLRRQCLGRNIWNVTTKSRIVFHGVHLEF